MNRPPPWMRSAVSGRHSPAMHRVYRRRRIVAAAVVAVPVLLIIFLLTRIGGGGGGKGKVATGGNTTTSRAPITTTTVVLTPAAALASWHLPLALSREVVLPINGEIGIFGGLSTSGINDRIYEIDPTNGQATPLGTMPAGVRDAAGAVIGSSYYVFGGTTRSGTTAAVQQFSFANSTTIAGSVIANLPAKRAELETAAYNASVYLIGGFDGSSYLGTVLGSPDGMNFTTAAQLNPAVRYSAVAVLNHSMYVIGGEIGPDAADSTAVQAIDLTSGTVTQLPVLAKGLSHAVALTFNNTIYVFGGRSGGHAIDTISRFLPSTGALVPVAVMPAALSDLGAVVMGQTAYLFGGENDSATPSTDVIQVTLNNVPVATTIPLSSSTSRATSSTTNRATSTTNRATSTTNRATSTTKRATSTTK